MVYLAKELNMVLRVFACLTVVHVTNLGVCARRAPLGGIKPLVSLVLWPFSKDFYFPYLSNCFQQNLHRFSRWRIGPWHILRF